MPFGATVLDDGRVRFRLWAPAARQVDLCFEKAGDQATLPMLAAGDGWFELETARARAGSQYRYLIDGGVRIPDPASRYNPGDVHGASEAVDPLAFDWQDGSWRGRRWDDAVIYELHVGAFTPEGDFTGVKRRLDYLADLGVTALELMPIADFPGACGWGYDGVLPFAPDCRYGRPEQLKDLVQSAHGMGLMVFLDVVYNHFGPDGNYLHVYAPQFFTDRHQTPWGAAINFDGPASRTVRDFFIHNALYWLEEFHLDGLRIDAVHAMADDSTPDFLTELAAAVHCGPGRTRPVHLMLENHCNSAWRLEREADGRPRRYVAQWNDDFHHSLHVVLTNERDGYYADYAREPIRLLGRCLTEGFAYQGEISVYRGSRPRGEPSGHLPPVAFVSFLQNHDQVGNRAFGERLTQLAAAQALAAAAAVMLLSPSPPLLFMGEEFGAATPFLFFCDFAAGLASAVRDGRRKEFARFARFSDPRVAAAIPDPGNPDTFARTKLDWESLTRPPHSDWLRLHRTLLAIRQREIVPLLPRIGAGRRAFREIAARSLEVRWHAGDGVELVLLANLGDAPVPAGNAPAGRLIYSTDASLKLDAPENVLPPWSATWLLTGTTDENYPNSRSGRPFRA